MTHLLRGEEERLKGMCRNVLLMLLKTGCGNLILLKLSIDCVKAKKSGELISQVLGLRLNKYIEEQMATEGRGVCGVRLRE